MNAQAPAPADLQLYFMDTGHQRDAVGITHSEQINKNANAPWLIIGRNAEEYLA